MAEMADTINLEDFLSSKKIVHGESEINHTNGIRFLIENQEKENADIITYNYTKHFSMFGISVLEMDKKGNYFYEYSLDRNGDIIDNIRFESLSNLKVQLSYYIGGIEYSPEEIDKFVVVSAQYHDFKVRITFLEKPNPGDEFKILSRYYLINLQDKGLLSKNRIRTENNIYNYGMCIKLNNT
jgi:hypothetical protein